MLIAKQEISIHVSYSHTDFDSLHNDSLMPIKPKYQTTLLTGILTLLTSCTATDREMLAKAAASGSATQAIDSYARQKAAQYERDPGAFLADLQNIKALLDVLRGNAEDKWGDKEADLPGNDKYVKYTDQYQSKAIIDFKAGRITVETINAKDHQKQLHHAIVTTLLSTDDPSATDIFTDKEPEFNGQPFLYGQVVDQDGKAIRYQWRAGRFADHLMKAHLKVFDTDKGRKHSVTFPMVKNHYALRKQQYAKYVMDSAARYQVAPSLIYAIIETESSFNPFAISSANAYGLMQIIPSTAGKDVYTRIKKRSGQPSREDLFRPQYNIDIGTAYLHILDDIYLKKVKDPQSREYTTISAYNGGAGNVFKTFSSNRSNAPDVINRLSPSQVYQKLVHNHPKAESRRYLQKVLEFRKKY